ncbi:metal ABC transporter solute-binding protein, Zn/Mn family [Clostridium sp.]|mgnify:FL=1|uniref:metal ABC transporter solute-binding protein, Zn/Mn family n=1 Tax=Clostridium sp. TaxID=1506 RepID=UPI0025880377|nr:zinc ABC transporter substrate-binding protein [Clostridium sp.]MDU4848239.1 zinc ABC transporter substrate-binding protein [Clostridium sp.]
MKKKIFLGVLLGLIGSMIIGCGQSNDKNAVKNEETKPSITVSIFPLKEFAEEIAGDKVDINCLVPNNMEPHDYEPKTKDFEKLINSDAFIYNGLGLEEWVEKVNEVIKNEDVPIVDSSKNVDSITIEDENHEEEHNHDNEEEHDHEHGAIDPHSWLSLKEAQVQSEAIKDTLIEIDPENKAYYEQNYNEFKQKLDDLYNKYNEKFQTLQNKNFITGHAAFGYLCRDFGLEQKSVENVFGEGEPTPKQLENLVNFCKENNITTIFSESLASPKVSETLAAEVGAKVIPIYTLESQEDNKSYLEAMEYNLNQIYNCLEK